MLIHPEQPNWRTLNWVLSSRWNKHTRVRLNRRTAPVRPCFGALAAGCLSISRMTRACFHNDIIHQQHSTTNTLLRPQLTQLPANTHSNLHIQSSPQTNNLPQQPIKMSANTEAGAANPETINTKDHCVAPGSQRNSNIVCRPHALTSLLRVLIPPRITTPSQRTAHNARRLCRKSAGRI